MNCMGFVLSNMLQPTHASVRVHHGEAHKQCTERGWMKNEKKKKKKKKSGPSDRWNKSSGNYSRVLLEIITKIA
jgi:hypothetical protein